MKKTHHTYNVNVIDPFYDPPSSILNRPNTSPTPYARTQKNRTYIYRGIFLARANFTKRIIKRLNPGCEEKKDINGAPQTFKLGDNHWGIILKGKEKEEKNPLPF